MKNLEPAPPLYPEPRASARAVAHRLRCRKGRGNGHHPTGTFLAALLIGLTLWFAPAALAQQVNAPTSTETVTPERKGTPADAPVSAPAPPITLDAYDSVREGNRLLRGGATKDALHHYEHAEKLQPDAREIAFAEGLSHYQLGEYENAREAFQRAWLGKSDALADDALYSEGAAYHAEALAAKDKPEIALERLENAMQRYQSVLAHQPDHKMAKDANYKAGTAWRKIKQQLQQQQQQKKDNKDDKKKDDDKKNDKDKQDQSKKSDQQKNQHKKDKDQKADDEQKNQNQDKPSQDQQKPEDTQEPQSKDQKDSQKQANQDNSDKKESQSEKQTAAQQQQQDKSLEQARRKLREMMQAQRQRQKNRKKHRAIIPIRPTEKDW